MGYIISFTMLICGIINDNNTWVLVAGLFWIGAGINNGLSNLKGR